MKIKLFPGALLVAVATAILPAGCDRESSDQIQLTVSPNSLVLPQGQSQAFTASGWQDYTWSLQTPGIGVLSAKKGDSTVYTAVRGPVSTNETLTQVLVVSVTVPASGTPSTNVIPGTTQSITAEAMILHVYSP